MENNEKFRELNNPSVTALGRGVIVSRKDTLIVAGYFLFDKMFTWSIKRFRMSDTWSGWFLSISGETRGISIYYPSTGSSVGSSGGISGPGSSPVPGSTIEPPVMS